MGGTVLIACWSVKGGSGTTVVAASLALLASRAGPARLVDAGGDVPAALGITEPAGPGLADWAAAGDDVDASALVRIEIAANPSLRVVPLGRRPVPDAAAGRVAQALAGDSLTIVDCGPPASPVACELASAADLSLLVLRPCFLALRRATGAAVRPSAVVVVEEPGRALRARDVEEVLGVPIWARVVHDAAIARAVDAGLLAARLPRLLEKALSTSGRLLT